MTQKKADKIAEEITNKLLDYNLMLYKLELEENYEQCKVVQTALDLYITNCTKTICAIITGEYDEEEITRNIKANSALIFATIKEEQPDLSDYDFSDLYL